jgi:hypothetical protein
MSFQLAGQVVGSFFGPWGAMIGGMIGGAIDSATADGPPVGDLSAPGLQLGRQLPRVYGRVRLPCNPIWASDFRATEHGGKGGEPPGPNSYSLDMLCAVADGSNVIAVTRIWVNKKLVFTALTESSDESITNSQDADYWSSFELLTGGPSQVPWSTYEDDVGAANAPAYRNICTIGFADLQCGGGKTPPAVEVEVITAGTQGEIDPLTLLQSRFIGASADDESAYARGAPDISATGVTLSEGAVTISAPDGSAHRLFYSPTGLASNGTDALTFEAIIRLDASLPITPTPGVTFNWVGEATHRFNWPSSTGYVSYDNSGAFGVEGQTDDGMVGIDMHVALVFGPTSLRAYAGPAGGTSTLIYENVGDFRPDTDEMEVTIGDGIGGGPAGMVCSGFRVRQEEVYAGGGFTAPSAIPPPDGFHDTWTPLTVTLDDIISDELQLNPEVPSTDFDVTDLSSIEVIGYTAAGSQARTAQELCEVHYVDVVPGNPIRFQRRGTTSVSTIPFVDTGVGVDDASSPFTGLKRGNADERPAIAALRFPLIDRDHEAGYERGDRLSTDSDDVRTIETRVVMGAEKAKGRAITATLLDKVRSHTAPFSLSDKYAKLEPADVYTPEDNDGNSYRLRAVRFAYADGVKSIDWELDDTTALVETGLTDTSYTPSIEVAGPPVVTLRLFDVPIVRDADDDYGLYAVVTATGDYAGATVFSSPDDVTYTEVGSVASRGTAGTCTALGSFASDGVWDTVNSFTVTLDQGTLSSTTKAGIEADGSVNCAWVGTHGRWECIRYATATLSAPGIYVLSNLLRGQQGTEQNMGNHASGDAFCVIGTAGTLRITGTASDVGALRYFKAVRASGTLAATTAVEITTAEEGLTPYAPVDVRASRASNGDITLTWNRRSRLASTFLSTTQPPLGETSEAYAVQIMASSAFAAVTRTISATSASCAYTLAQQEADFGSAPSTLYVRVRQVGAAVGNGHAIDSTVPVGSTTTFVPLASNSYPDVRLAIDNQALVTRNATSLMGLYRYTDGDTELDLLSTTSAVNATRYVQGAHLHATDAGTGDWVMYLRGLTNPSGVRKLMVGNLPAGTAAAVVPAFMPTNPPFALGFISGTFIALTNDGTVYHSVDSGANWTSEGTLSGFTAPAAPSSFASGRMVVVAGRLVLLYGGEMFYCTAGDGLVWAAATGDIASAPATYTDSFIVGAVDTLGAVGCCTARGEVGGVYTALIYTTTDGESWSEGIASTGFFPTPYEYDIELQNKGCLAFDGAFYCTFIDTAPDVGRTTLATLGTFDGKVVYYAPLARSYNSRATDANVVQFQVATGDPIYTSADADAFTETVDWP